MTKKENKILLFLVIILIIISLIFPFIITKLDRYFKFDKPIYITVQNESNRKKQNYKLNDNKKLHKIYHNFNYDNKVYNLNECYDSYISNNTVLNKLNENKCEALKLYSDDKIVIEIIDEISHIEHDIFKAKIIKTDNNYYAIVELNVNLWSPYEFYIYDKKSKSLKLIHTFDGENVIAIKD